MWEDGGRNRKLEQAENFDIGSYNRDFSFNVAAWGVQKGANSLVDWLKCASEDVLLGGAGDACYPLVCCW